MKKIIIALLALFVAQSTFAQIVSGNDPIGTIYTYDTKVEGMNLVLEQTLLNIDGGRFTFKSKQELPKPLGTLEIENSYIVKDGTIIEPLEERQKAMKEQMAKMSGLDVQISMDGDAGFTPLTAKVGDEFEMGSYSVVLTVMGMDQNMEMTVTSCKVIAEESITTPAGTFDTFVLETIGETTVEVMGQKQNMKTSTKQWIAPNVGVIQSIIDDGSGKITTQTLKSIVKP